MHGQHHVLAGHACGVLGRAGVAAGVDGEGLPDLQGAWRWKGSRRGEGSGDKSSGREAARLQYPDPVSLVPASWPASLPTGKQPGAPGSRPASAPARSLAVGKSLPLSGAQFPHVCNEASDGTVSRPSGCDVPGSATARLESLATHSSLGPSTCLLQEVPWITASPVLPPLAWAFQRTVYPPETTGCLSSYVKWFLTVSHGALRACGGGERTGRPAPPAPPPGTMGVPQAGFP